MRNIYLLVFVLCLSFFKPDNITGQTGTSHVKDIPELSSVDGLSSLFYSVQVGNFGTSKTKEQLFNIKDLYSRRTYNDRWIYVSGIYKTPEEAEIARLQIIKKGVPDAFVAVFNKKPGSNSNAVSGSEDFTLISFKLDSLSKIINNTKVEYGRLADSLNKTVNIINNLKTNNLNTSNSSNQFGLFYWILVIIALILAILAVILILYYQKKNQSKSDLLETRIVQERQIFKGEIGKAKNELLLENNHTRKLVMLDRLMNTIPLGHHNDGIDEGEMQKLIGPDSGSGVSHGYSLKMANEILNMKNQLDNLSGNTPGKNKLEEIVSRVEEQFEDSFYKITDLKGFDYKKGLDVEVNSAIPKTKIGEKLIISKVIKPQVDFKGETIQKAIVEVSTEKVKTIIK